MIVCSVGEESIGCLNNGERIGDFKSMDLNLIGMMSFLE